MSRTLAEQGAEVVQLVDPGSFEHESLYIDACAGFHSCWLDLKQPEGRQRALELAPGADVFVENFRGRSMSKLGFFAAGIGRAATGDHLCLRALLLV